MSKLTSLRSWTGTLSSLALLAVIALWVFSTDHPPVETTFELPEEIKPPQLTVPESPLLNPRSTHDILVRDAQQIKAQRAQLEASMMNGELDRSKHVPAGATDPDAMWRGQVDRANRTLQENGMEHLNLQER